MKSFRLLSFARGTPKCDGSVRLGTTDSRDGDNEGAEAFPTLRVHKRLRRRHLPNLPWHREDPQRSVVVCLFFHTPAILNEPLGLD